MDPFGNTQRVATVLMYLQGAEEGGETVFLHPDAKWASLELKQAARAAGFSEARAASVHAASKATCC